MAIVARIPIKTITTTSSMTVKPCKDSYSPFPIGCGPSFIHQRSLDKGFTILELIFVIVILSIIAKSVSSLWPGSNINLNAEAQQLASEIRYAQSLAQARAQRFRINLNSSHYSITDAAGTNYYTDPLKGQNTINFASGTTASWSSTILPNNLIGFDETGTPYADSNATSTALASTATITLSNGGMSRTISVTPQTGAVTVQ
jgi:prepilin-type N-terminal cleavage/methylation domain-containing protein